MKQTISGILVGNATDCLRRARAAADTNFPNQEISECIGAQLMIAMTLEGTANEIGDIAFGRAFLGHFERASVVLKWHLLSSLDGRQPFDLSKEPPQTVQLLMQVRNQLAHPKVENFGDEIMLRTRTGDLLRNVSLDHKVQDGDHIIYGAGELLRKFNYLDTKARVVRSLEAVDALCVHLSLKGLQWVSHSLKQARDS
ncbi:hypothetical protein [Plantactinospora sp. CA-290183]|uniref:hypothetical protein n=1 Tax=Plantactinospora sp. CA-290183 TaxID=3240006 RepID=UPI003D8B27FE